VLGRLGRVQAACLSCRNAICAPMYTEHELLGRVLLFHCTMGFPAATFDWRDYVGRRARTEASRPVAWFIPDEAVQRVASEVLEAGLFVPASTVSQWFRKKQPSSCVRVRWTGFKLKARPLTSQTFALDPFEARVTKEESAVRLALEAQRLGVRWDDLAVRQGKVGLRHKDLAQ
jgi:hypothetical protein